MFKFGIIIPLLIASLACQASGKTSFPQPQQGFIENKGQVIDQDNKPNPAVLYLLNTPGMNVQLRKNGFSYDVCSGEYKPNPNHIPSNNQNLRNPNPENDSLVAEYHFHRIDFNLLNANPNPAIETSAPSTDYQNYYTTGTPVEGVKEVRSFNSVTYKNIYPGIALQFDADLNGQFEYNFIIQPGADIASIQIKIAGPERIKSFKEKIQMVTSIGDVDETIPLCYYSLNENRVPVKGRFKKIADQIYGFEVDQTIPKDAVLLIDPIPTRRWGTYFGDTGMAQAGTSSGSIDQSGNLIITGFTTSTNNIATTGAFQVILGGSQDAFLEKFSPDGQQIWGTYYGGIAIDAGTMCRVDRFGNIILVGYTSSPGNIATPGAYQTTIHGLFDGFVAKFTSGGQRIWGSYYGGTETQYNYVERINSCDADTNGNIYFAGHTSSPNYISSPGAHQQNYGGSYDSFLVKFSPDGQRLWGTYYGGSGQEDGGYCAVTKDGVIYLSGSTKSSDNIATAGSFLPTYNGNTKTFLAAFNPQGQRLWGTYYAGENQDGNAGCAADTNSNVYIYGTTWSYTNIATSGAFQENQIADTNAYLAKFNSAGQRIWGSYYGVGYTSISSAAVDDSGYVFIAGVSGIQNSVIAPPGAFQPVYRGLTETFLAKFSSDGSRRIWGTYYGGTGYDNGWAAVDHSDNIYLCGHTTSNNNSNDNTSLCTRQPWGNYIATPGSFQQELMSFQEVYIVKFSDCVSPDTASQIYAPLVLCQNSTGVVFYIDPVTSATQYHWCVSGNLTITAGQGTTSITVDVGPTPGLDTISVYGINACDAGFPKVIVRQVVARPVPVLSGPDTTCAGINNVFTTSGGKSYYQWTVSPGGTITLNGTSTDSSCTVKWSTSGAHWVKVGYTDTTGCASLNPTQFNVWVNPGLITSVSISSSANPVCSGTSVTLTASPVNGGLLPIYLWKVNGTVVGINNSSYTYTPVNGDIILCQMTSSLIGCLSGNPATSNQIVMTVNINQPVSITIFPDENPVCAGTSVTFTANPTHGGSLPGYQWKVNGVSISGATNSTYTFVPVNGDVVTCQLTSSDNCVTGNPAISPPLTMTVTPNLAVTVSITPSANPFCTGSQVTFIATPNHGGLFPTYLWKVNGGIAGTNSSSFTYAPLNGDVITCELTSSDNCVTGNPATSAPVTMTASPILAVSVTITASSNPFCAGSQVTFTATPVHGGLVPGYQWKVNGGNTGTNSSTFSYSPANGDQVSCILNSSALCITGNPALSNIITMIVNTNLPAGVSISTLTNPFCPGTSVTITATPTNGGFSPIYQWKLNGSNAGLNLSTFTFNPAASDSVRCVMTSNQNCVTGNPASSAKIIMTERAAPNVTFTSCFDTVTIVSAKPIKLKGGLPIGGQYSGPGVNSFTGIFTPSVAGTGLKTIMYSYSNVYTCVAAKSKTILVQATPVFTCGNNLIDIRDNKVYHTVQIGTQCWMKVDLDFGFGISELIPQTDNCTAEKYSHNSSFYQWDELMLYNNIETAQGLCPPGWHIPSSVEWDQLLSFYSGPGQAGGPMKDSLSVNGFNSYQPGFFYLNNLWAFTTGLPASSMYWTSTSSGTERAVARGLNEYDPSVSIYNSSRGNAFSVRCLKD